MTVSPAQIIAAQAKGLINVVPLAEACDKLKFPFYLACTILDKETDGRNIFGHDKGGAFSDPTGANIEVTEGRYREFRRLIDSGMTSNGVGPLQITWRGYFPVMEAEGLKPWIPADNIMFGISLLSASLKRGLEQGLTLEKAFWNAAKSYNGNASYADDAAVRARTWAATVGSSDMTEGPPVSYFTEKVQWDGPYTGRPRYVDRRTRDQLHEVEHIVGHRLVMYQGSKSDGDLSADTHAGWGAADIGPTGGDTWREIETAARQVGMAAWLRDWPQNYHVHALSIDNPELAPWAKVQVNAYLAGYDGLGPNARSGRDTGNRSYTDVTWENYMPTAKDIANELVNELVREAPRVAKAFLSVDNIIDAGKDEPNPANKFQAPKTFYTGDHDLLVDIREALKKLALPKP